MSFTPHKYKVNQKFIVNKNNQTYIGTIIKLADIDEFGWDFYFLENNYVVTFDIDNLPLATYNFIKNNTNKSKSNNLNISYNYVMNEKNIQII